VDPASRDVSLAGPFLPKDGLILNKARAQLLLVVFLRDEQVVWIRDFSFHTGLCSDQLWGIDLIGLEMAWCAGYRRVQLEVDSKLAVDILLQQNSLRGDYAHLISAVQAMLRHP
jgi:hypothetical protein